MSNQTGFIAKFIGSAVLASIGFGMVVVTHDLLQFIGVVLMFVPVVAAIGTDIRHPGRP